jgi:hypothetical protein
MFLIFSIAAKKCPICRNAGKVADAAAQKCGKMETAIVHLKTGRNICQHMDGIVVVAQS